MIFLTQWKCPEEHCTIALAWDSTTTKISEVVEQGERVFQKAGVNRWCGICGSRDIAPEHDPTPYASIDEAMPRLCELEALNSFARLVIGNRY